MRLSHGQRHEIMKAYLSGGSPTEIGRQYGVSAQYVITTARRWQRAIPRVKKEPMKKRALKAAMPVRRLDVDEPPRQAAKALIVLPQQVGSGRQSTAGYLKLM